MSRFARQQASAQAALDHASPPEPVDAYPEEAVEMVAAQYVRANEVEELITELCEGADALDGLIARVGAPSNYAFQTFLRRLKYLREDVEDARNKLMAQEDAA